jgi:hypothetical protein
MPTSKAELLSSASPEVKQSFAEMLAAQSPSLPYNPDASLQLTFQTGSKYLSSSDSDEDDLDVKAHEARSNSAVSYDMPSALTTLAFATPQPSVRPANLSPTKSFAGVPTGYLPDEITDEIDVVALQTSGPENLLPPSHTPARMTGLGVRIAGYEAPSYEPLVPDLPDEVEEERLRARAEAEKQKAEEERQKRETDEVLQMFFATKAML